jgi:UDP-GlcNAc:undecaprenyl-phosphate GlcNAc-1-phosphate transferase
MVIRWARRRNLVDLPDVRKLHTQPIARVGGIAIFAATMGAMLAPLFLDNRVGTALRANLGQIVVLLIASTMVFGVGLLDDLRQARIRTKLGVQVLAALFVCGSGIHLSHISIRGLGTLDLAGFGPVITFIWIIGITNAINLIDGLDGLAAGISAIAATVIALMAIVQGNVILAIVMLSVSGALGGFLFFNFHPAKIFMGDCGSLFLGFIIATSSIMTASLNEALIGLGLPILVLGIPIFDTLLCMLRRFLARRGIMSPDRGHFHHRLMDMGFKQHHAAIIAYVVTLAITGLGLLMLVSQGAWSVLLLVGCIGLFLLVFRMVGAVELGSTLKSIRERTRIAHRQRIERKNFEHAQLHLQKARNFDDWWQCLCETAHVLHFSRMSLEVNNGDTRQKRFEWSIPDTLSLDDDQRLEELLEAKIPVASYRTSAYQASVAIEVRKHTSLESAGQRVALFTRLLEESPVFWED